MRDRIKSLGNVAGLAIAWCLLFFSFGAALGKTFMSLASVEQIFRQSTVVALCGIGMTFVIMSAGIDLSVGSIVALVSVVVAYALQQHLDPSIAILCGLVAGTLSGLLNGAIITKLKVTPFIVTLGTFLALRGVAKGIAKNQKIDADFTWINDLLARVHADHRWMVFPPGVWAMLVLAVLGAIWLRYTRLGRHIQAVGSNELAARLCGVPVERVKLAVYSFMGLCAGMAGVAIFARLSVGDPTTAQGLELQAIAAAVIGGASLMGGTGSIAGTLFGALIMETIGAGSSQLGWPNWVQEIVTGAIIVAAVALDRVRHRRAT
ncbi:MAG TPA: ABC transporter permease [Fimbriimonadaceae bacterium]|nr:ABC transporter permease [Fimbriimonadaceae bacterium]